MRVKVPVAWTAAIANIEAKEADESTGNDCELIGNSDADADAARSDADVDPDDAACDSDGVPVGRADLKADIDRSSRA